MSLHQATMQPVSAALGLEIEPAVAQPAPGQVPAVQGAPPANPLPAAPNGATNAPTRVQAVQKRERRVTRSSRGGADNGNSATVPLDSEGAAVSSWLPARTRILLTTKAPNHLVPYQVPPSTGGVPTAQSPPPLGAESSAPDSEAIAARSDETEPAGGERPPAQKEKPLFRPLGETELLPPRGTRHAAVDVDTSDAFYLRLHRYPEVLEKRASRLERERLIHERSKLINELEELRGRAWVYAGTSAGGRAEEERQRRIKAMGEKLARYDSLLPNQPRKSNFLNLAGAGAAPPGAPPSNRDGRTASPSLQAPPPSRRRSTIAHSTSRVDEPPRPPTPVSASVSESSGNRTTIRIKFGPASSRTSSPAPSSLRTGGGAPGTDLERYTTKGELRKGPKRDRRAERARAEERRRLGLKPRSSIDKATARLQDGAGRGEEPASSRPRATPVKRARRTSAAGVSYNETDDEEEDELDDNEEDMDEDEDEDQLAEDRDGHAGGGEGGRAPSRPAKLVRKRLPDSFFHSAALRDAVLASQGPNARRASTRVVYAFGQRLPDQALVRVGDFELCGGVAGNTDDDAPGRSRTRLEEMVRVRMERHGEEAVILGGHVFPKSAVDAWSKDPLHDASMVRPHRLQESVQPAAPTTGTFTNANGSAFAAPLPAARSTVASPVASHPGSPDAAARPAPAFCSPLKRARSGSSELTSG